MSNESVNAAGPDSEAIARAPKAGRTPVQTFERVVKLISEWMNYIGLVLLAFIMFLGTANVIARYFVSRPIIGADEISSSFLGAMTMLGWGYTQVVRGHVGVDMVTSRLRPVSRSRIGFGVSILSFIIFALVTWRAWLFTIMIFNGHNEVYTVSWPLYPFQALVSIGAGVLCLVFITDAIQYYREMKGVK